MTAPTLPPGTLLLSTIDGRLGWAIKLGQRIFAHATKSDAQWSHAAIIGAGDTVYQAMPHGIERAKLSDYINDLRAGDQVMFINTPLDEQQRQYILTIGDDLVARNVGYSFATYLYLILKRLGCNTRWLRQRIADSGDMICSGAADYMLTAAGCDVFTDNRWVLDVVPSDFVGLVRDDPRFTIIDTVKVLAQ